MNGRRLALFDFDGTLTSKDSMFAFVQHVCGPARAALGYAWLLPMFGGYALGRIPGDSAKVRLIRHFLKGRHRDELARAAETFADEIDGFVRPEGMNRVEWHRDQGHEIVVVSASLDVWLLPWMKRHGLHVLCTRGRFEDDRFLGELDGPNCNREQKVVRIREAYDLDAFDFVYAYGDTEGDKAMLSLADEASFRPFHDNGVA